MLLMKIYNGTRHEVCIYNIEDLDTSDPRRLRAKPGTEPSYVIPAGKDLNAVPAPSEPVEGDAPFPLVYDKQFISCDAVPEGYDLIVCSRMYREAARFLGQDYSKLACVQGVVYADDSPRPIGCLELAILG